MIPRSLLASSGLPGMMSSWVVGQLIELTAAMVKII
jgi:hypothetical protein